MADTDSGGGSTNYQTSSSISTSIGSWVTDSANSINSIISTYYQLKATKESEKRAREQAALAREDQLAQNRIQNGFQQ